MTSVNFKTYTILQLTGCVLSLSGSLVIITLFYFKSSSDFRKNHRYILYLTCSALMESSSLMVFLCFGMYYDPGNYKGICYIDGCILHFGFLASVCWTSVISMDMLVQYFMKKIKYLELIYHIYAWGLPLVYVVVVASARQFGQNSMFCQTHGLNGVNGRWILFPAIHLWLDHIKYCNI